MSEDDELIWARWLGSLKSVRDVKIRRCFIMPEIKFTSLLQRQLYHFADASSKTHGIVSYLRVVSPDDCIFCNFDLGKARLAPLKSVSMPRLELVASTLAAIVDVALRQELGKMVPNSVFWTDSLAVLFMIKNSSQRFPVFVANRLAQIEEVSDPGQWRFIECRLNPAGVGTRALSAEQLTSRWLRGPEFLRQPESFWPDPPCFFPELPVEFKVLKRTVVLTKLSQAADMDRRFARVSS